MLNGNYPLLLIEMGLIPIPVYIDENVFKIALRGEDKAISLNTTKTGNQTIQIIDQNTLQLSFTVAKESQYGIIIVSLLDKLYSLIGNLYSKYKNSENSGSVAGFLSGVEDYLSKINYSVSYFSETESISNALITSFSKTSEAGSSSITVNLTLEKKAPEPITGGLNISDQSSKIGNIEVSKGV